MSPFESQLIIVKKTCDLMGLEPARVCVQGGVAGLLLDARGRPLYFPENDSKRRELLLSWFKATDMYDEEALGRLL